jgi:hypothetical protein
MPDKELTKADVAMYAPFRKDPIPPKYPPALLTFVVLLVAFLLVVPEIVSLEKRMLNHIAQSINNSVRSQP